jgi:hypothetical protein
MDVAVPLVELGDLDSDGHGGQVRFVKWAAVEPAAFPSPGRGRGGHEVAGEGSLLFDA